MKNALASILLLSSAIALAGEPMDMSEVSGKAPFVTTTASDRFAAGAQIDPFQNSALPRPSHYKGGFFELNHNYPEKLKKHNKPYPWEKVTGGGRINSENAYDYVLAIKEYVSKDMRALTFDQSKPNNPNWFQSIWLGSERDPIHGVYVGSAFPAGTLNGKTEQRFGLTTYVYVLYDERAAKTLGDIWGTDLDSAMNPTFTTGTTQYAEGSVIVKFAFVTPCGADWSPMKGTASWTIFAPLNTGNGSGNSNESKCKNNGSNGSNTTPVLTDVYLMQFDMIVKDSKAAPETGWVFTTLVYDKDARGKDAWDKMIPLGATWGGDPDIINLSDDALTPPVKVNTQLTQNWINMKSPEYARSTLGWDGRLSGPNDGAVITPAWGGDQYYHKGIASAGCINCHSSAQYPMTSFLLPTTTNPPNPVPPPLSSAPNAAALVTYAPGSDEWMRWFQHNSGATPMGPKTSDGKEPIALDYDMVTAFKAVRMWEAAVKIQESIDKRAAR